MRNFISILSFATVIAVSGATTVNATEVAGSASVTVVAPITIQEVKGLKFGRFVPSTTGQGTITLDLAQSTTVCVNVTCLGNESQPGVFIVNGASQDTYTISVPVSVSITNEVGNVLVISPITTDKTSGVLQNGQDGFRVGGVLNSYQNVPAGSYNGTFVVTVEYQ
jgi:hypothetical protein